MAYVPTIENQFPNKDFRVIKNAYSADPYNQYVHIQINNDSSSTQIADKQAFEESNLGYVRVSQTKVSAALIVNENNSSNNIANNFISDKFGSNAKCPTGMIGLSYYWSDKRQKSCTILSVNSDDSNADHNQFLLENCRTFASEEFLGCVFKEKYKCIGK